MKKLILSIVLATTCFVGYSQTNTNPPAVSSPIWGFLTQGSNYVAAIYPIYDMTSHKVGGGIGLGYRLNTYVVPTLRFDAVVDPADNQLAVFMPSGNLQLQVPVKLLGKWEVTPFATAGVAPKLGSKSGDGSAVGIFGAGLFFRINKTTTSSWAIPDYVLADYERWTGGGFDNNQVRAGLGWKLGH